ncbi:MAG: thiamine pyrophosphate-requiring protein [Acidimicrobiales bacterium]
MSDAAKRSVADAYLDLLQDRGVEYLFGNAGTDFGPLIDAYARRDAAGESSPRPIMVPHEVTGTAMAHGYAMVSGKTPAVMVHTIAGTANSIGGLINANRSQVPIFFTAGRTPLAENNALGVRDLHIHWAQESFDQGGMVREWVKWDYELRTGSDLPGVVNRAFAIAEAEPRGPVYLTLPREVLAAEHDPANDRPVSMTAGTAIAAPADLDAAVERLATATNPIIVTRSAGRRPEAVAALTRLADQLGAPVFDPFPTHTNIDFDHPRRFGMLPDRYLAGADVIVVIECDVPWTPKNAKPDGDATVIAIGADPLHSRYPVRGFGSDISLSGACGHNLGALADRLDGRLDANAVEQRSNRWAAAAAELRETARGKASDGQNATPLSKPWVSSVLDELLPEDAILVDELGSDSQQLTMRGPGRFFGGPPAGFLGWGVGAALGAKLAAPDRTVVGMVGDGSYLFSVPSSAHWISRRYDLPVLYLVWNNAKWGAVEGSTRMVYPDGHAARADSFSFSDLQPALDYEAICSAAGGLGERVDDPADLFGALERGLKAVSEGRQALINLIAHD